MTESLVQVAGLKRRYLDLMGACNYTSKTPSQIEHAVARGALVATFAKDESKSYEVCDLDAYMRAEKLTGKLAKKKRKSSGE